MTFSINKHDLFSRLFQIMVLFLNNCLNSNGKKKKKHGLLSRHDIIYKNEKY